MSEPAHQTSGPKFVSGSIFRHVLTMTATGSIGLMAIFLVDFANLFYISMLGKQELAAAIGYAGTILFFNISITLGIMIAAIALVSRALGAGNKVRARAMSGSALILMVLITTIISALFFPFIEPTVSLLGARDETLAIATDFLRIVVPSMPLMGLGMCASGLLRAVGDAKRAMYVTLGAGIAAAILDPIFIFTFDLGLYGAAYVMVISRVFTIAIGLYGVIKIHDSVCLPTFGEFQEDTKGLVAIAAPAVLTNIATPVGNAYVTASIAPYGDEAVAGWAIIGRFIPVVFGFIFALSGAIGPIIGQNYGAQEFHRVKRTITDSLIITVAYTAFMWLVSYLLRDIIIAAFNATGSSAELVSFFINFVVASFVFNGVMFVANASFNNLGYAKYSTVLNWGKATLGTIPFVWAGGQIAGANGVVAGQGLGSVVFGAISIVVCHYMIVRIIETKPDGPLPPPLWRMALSAFSSGKSANIQ